MRLLVVLLPLLWAVSPQDTSRPGAAAASRPSSAASAPTAESLPAELLRKLRPGERVTVRLPQGLKTGILFPDGSYLPCLNGVTGAPAVHIAQCPGPMPPVIAKVCGKDGLEWWEHTDGSMTTTQWQEISDGRGGKIKTPTTMHASPVRK